MDVIILARAENQQNCAQAVAMGLRKHGHTVRVQAEAHVGMPPGTVVCWGWKRGAVLRAEGHDVLVMERGYLGDRFEWYSLGWNGLNGRAEFRGVRGDGGRRFNEHFAPLMRPWRTTPGKYALLVGQVPGDASLQGRDLTSWYAGAALQARTAYGMPVLFREHPEALKRGVNRSPSYSEPCRATSLQAALAGAHVVITYNSNTGVDAIMAGVPVVVGDPQGSMAWPIATHRIGDVKMPRRSEWAHELAWKQFTLSEIARGIPFEYQA